MFTNATLNTSNWSQQKDHGSSIDTRTVLDSFSSGSPSVSRHGKIKASFILHTGLTKTVDCILRFLAMAELKRAFTLLIWLNENDEKQKGGTPIKLDSFPSSLRWFSVIFSIFFRPSFVRNSFNPRSVLDRSSID